MNCIIVDDEPLAREAMKLLIEEAECLQLVGSLIVLPQLLTLWSSM